MGDVNYSKGYVLVVAGIRRLSFAPRFSLRPWCLGEFVEENAELLRSIPPPMVALNYYRNEDLFLVSA